MFVFAHVSLQQRKSYQLKQNDKKEVTWKSEWDCERERKKRQHNDIVEELRIIENKYRILKL